MERTWVRIPLFDIFQFWWQKLYSKIPKINQNMFGTFKTSFIGSNPANTHCNRLTTLSDLWIIIWAAF